MPDPLFAYLWHGNHKRLTDAERNKRIASTKQALEYVPQDSLFTDYLAYAMPTTDSPPWFHIASCLGMAAHIINRKAWLNAGENRLYPLFWIGVVAQSSTERKSSSVNIVRSLLKADQHYHNICVDSSTMDALIEDLGFILSSDKSAAENELVKIKADCRKHDSGTGQFTKGTALFHLNEIATLLGNLGKNHNMGGKSQLTEWFDCPPEFTKRTKTQGSVYIYRPMVNILGATMADTIEDPERERADRRKLLEPTPVEQGKMPCRTWESPRNPHHYNKTNWL